MVFDACNPQSTHVLIGKERSLPRIKPTFVVVTGDLVDAKALDFTSSAQEEREWITYKSLLAKHLKANNLDGPGQWLDMRGNHDWSVRFSSFFFPLLMLR
jgi:hypothetical protein